MGRSRMPGGDGARGGELVSGQHAAVEGELKHEFVGRREHGSNARSIGVALLHSTNN